MGKETKKQKRKENRIKKMTKKTVRATAKMTKKAVRTTTDFFGITAKKTPSRFIYKESKFYFIFLFYAFLSVITLLILAPYSYYKVCELRYSHTFIDNKKIVFRGKMHEIYYQFVLGLILVVIILFFIRIMQQYWLDDILSSLPEFARGLIPGLIAAAPTMVVTGVLINRLFVWSIKNIFFVSDDTIDSFLNISYLKLSIIKAVVQAVLRKLASIMTVGFGEPFLLVVKERYIVSRQYISGIKMRFDGSVFESYKWFLWRYFLVIFTAGIYYPIYLYKTYQWTTIHMHIDDGLKHRKRLIF